MPASRAKSCGIDMEHVMSFVTSSNLTSIAVYLRYTDNITIILIMLC